MLKQTMSRFKKYNRPHPPQTQTESRAGDREILQPTVTLLPLLA
jgi:hypothetical protein